MEKFSLPTTTRSADDPHVRWLLLATAATVLLSFVPFGDAVTYPIRLFVTFIHETSHATAAVLTFGSIDGMTVSPDESGLTWVRGGFGPLVSSAGYLGTTLFGALLLVLARRQARAKGLSMACAGIVLGGTLFFVDGRASWLVMLLLALAFSLWVLGARPGMARAPKIGLFGGSLLTFLLLIGFWSVTGKLFTWIVGLSLAFGLLALGRFAKPAVAHFLANFLAVQCSVNALVDLKTLFLISAMSNGHSDARNMEMMTHVPAVVWAVLWGVLSVAILTATLWIIRKRAAVRP